MAKILIIEDDKRICNILEDYLLKDGHTCHTENNGIEAINSFISTEPNIIVLDLMLPNLDGYKICQLIRTISDVPIIILTAKGEEVDKLKGYDFGADDYVTKPFSPKIMVAKINALLRRSEVSTIKDYINLGDISINLAQRKVMVDGEVIELTYKEFELLSLFAQNEGIVFSREHLLKEIWGYDYPGNTRTVDTHIKTLRQKLHKCGSYIITMIRSGYKFEVK